MKYLFFVLIILLSSLTYADTLQVGDFSLDIQVAEGSTINNGEFTIDINKAQFFNLVIDIPSVIVVTPPSGGGGGGSPTFVSEYIPFNFTIRNKKNTSYIDVVQKDENNFRFKVSINRSLSTDVVYLYYTINGNPFYRKPMTYDNKTSFMTLLTFNNKNDTLLKIIEGDLLMYYVEAKRDIRTIRTPNNFDVIEYSKFKPKIMFNYFNIYDFVWMLFIVIIILLFHFIHREKNQKV